MLLPQFTISAGMMLYRKADERICSYVRLVRQTKRMLSLNNSPRGSNQKRSLIGLIIDALSKAAINCAMNGYLYTQRSGSLDRHAKWAQHLHLLRSVRWRYGMFTIEKSIVVNVPAEQGDVERFKEDLEESGTESGGLARRYAQRGQITLPFIVW
jgi:hypothetical protein